METIENKPPGETLGAAPGSTCCDRFGGDDSPASNEDGTPAEIDGNDVIVRESWHDEYGMHFEKRRYPIDGQRFYWSNADIRRGG
jgi:hypothetical protein